MLEVGRWMLEVGSWKVLVSFCACFWQKPGVLKVGRTPFICLVLAAITLAVYWPVRGFDFINLDDNCYVTANPYVQAGLTRDGLAWAFGQLHGELTYWHPLTWVSHMLDCQLFGLDPGGHHLMNAL